MGERVPSVYTLDRSPETETPGNAGFRPLCKKFIKTVDVRKMHSPGATAGLSSSAGWVQDCKAWHQTNPSAHRADDRAAVLLQVCDDGFERLYAGVLVKRDDVRFSKDDLVQISVAVPTADRQRLTRLCLACPVAA